MVLGGAVAAGEDGIADTSTFSFEAVEDAAGPDEFSGENAEAETDDRMQPVDLVREIADRPLQK